MDISIIKNENDFDKVLQKYLSMIDKLPPLIVLSGKQHLFKKTFIKAICNAMFDSLSLSEMNYNIFYDKSDAIEASPVEIADTMPFISEKRLIVIYNYTQFTDKTDFIEYFRKPSPYAIFVLFTDNQIETDPIYKEAVKSKLPNASFINFTEAKREDFVFLIKSYMNKHNKNITTDALDYILENTALDYEVIQSNLKNICSYSGDKKYIEISDISNFTSGAKNAQIFDFLDALMARDKKKTFNIMKHLEKEAHTSIPLILLNFVAIFYLKIFPQSTNIETISKSTGINQYVLTKKKRFVNSYTLAEIVYYISELSKIAKFIVSKPPYVVRAKFDLFVFHILMKSK